MAGTWNGEPEIITLPDATVATVHAGGDPNDVGAGVMKALYGAAYGLKFALKKRGVEMRMGEPRARWAWVPGQESTGGMEGDWAVPVPEGTAEADLPQTSDAWHVSVAVWHYGECARIMHRGPYDTEKTTIARLAAFIEQTGYEIAGRHEEWYLAQPSAKVPKTVILYPVRCVQHL
jgi:hypothetical protein